jgi:hypothetical protein
MARRPSSKAAIIYSNKQLLTVMRATPVRSLGAIFRPGRAEENRLAIP